MSRPAVMWNVSSVRTSWKNGEFDHALDDTKRWKGYPRSCGRANRSVLISLDWMHSLTRFNNKDALSVETMK